MDNTFGEKSRQNFRIEIENKNTIIKEITDFDLEQTLECGQCFRFYKQDEEDDEFSIFTLGKATKYLLDLVATGSDEGAQKYISDYYTLCVYRGAITLAKAGMLPKEMFKLDYTLGRELASAALSVEDAKFVFIEDKSRTGSDLAEKTAIHSLIEKAEDIIYNTFVLE